MVPATERTWKTVREGGREGGRKGHLNANLLTFFPFLPSSLPPSLAPSLQDPFSMMALNGYLYGRGITDNKGPIMAMIFALKEMKEQGILKGKEGRTDGRSAASFLPLSNTS